MSERPKRDPRDAIADFLTEDIMSMSDEELLAEIIADGEDPEELAAMTRRAFDRALAEHDRRRALTPKD